MSAPATLETRLSQNDPITLFHAPRSRSLGVLALLESLDLVYALEVLNLQKGEQRSAAFRALNPMGKVPTLVHGGSVVTEQVAIFLYLTDLCPEAGLAPALDSSLRGPYLRWMVYYASCFEPAVTDRALKREPAPSVKCPYGDFDTMLDTLVQQLARGPFLLGDKLSAVDLLWGTALDWTVSFKLIPALPEIQRYVQAVKAHPAVVRARAKDEALAAAQA
jgi:glutathione S-transferase